MEGSKQAEAGDCEVRHKMQIVARCSNEGREGNTKRRKWVLFQEMKKERK